MTRDEAITRFVACYAPPGDPEAAMAMRVTLEQMLRLFETRAAAEALRQVAEEARRTGGRR